MDIVLSSLGLSDIVNATDELEANKLKEFKSLDLLLHDLIVMSVNDAVLMTLKVCGKSEWKMWRHLDAEHNRKDVASKYSVMCHWPTETKERAYRPTAIMSWRGYTISLPKE